MGVRAMRTSHRAEGPTSFEAPHPGVRDPRSRRRGEWSPFTNGLITGCLGLLVFLSFWTAATESPLGRVGSWATHGDTAGRFSIEYPAGWTTATQTEGGVAATHIGPSRRIYVEIVSQPTSSEQRALIGTGSVAYTVLQRWHHSDETYLRLRFPDYQPGAPGRTALGGRPAVWSRFTAGQGPPDELTGYHTTLLSRDRILLIIAVAPSGSWEEFEPIALHMLQSLRFDANPAHAPSH